ncbi:MAG: TMEM165/GDT1 family protein [Candidatus Tectomicrobia bacterium]|nr:TMEM165/GDT1 family protein [Candidatus Tectomicrobia bacterium]
MDLALALKTFSVIFLAELGDKTQLAILSIATSAHSRAPVFIGAALALVVTSLLAVLAGQGLSRIIPSALLERLVGLLFIAVGVWYLVGSK